MPGVDPSNPLSTTGTLIAEIGVSKSVCIVAGTPIILDLWKNGASIMNIQPEIEIGDFSTHTSATPGSIALLNEDFDIGDELRISVEQIGSTIAGVGLKATIVYNNIIPI